MPQSNLLPTASQDPFTAVYCALWDMLEAHEGFTGLVRVANRIKYLGPRLAPEKDTVTNSDLPEVTIRPVEGHTDYTTGQTIVVFPFDIEASTGNQRLDTLGAGGIEGAIFPVLWEILRAVMGWEQSIVALRHGGRRFVSMARAIGMAYTIDDKNKAPGMVGWSGAWRYEVYLTFDTLANAAAA